MLEFADNEVGIMDGLLRKGKDIFVTRISQHLESVIIHPVSCSRRMFVLNYMQAKSFDFLLQVSTTLSGSIS